MQSCFNIDNENNNLDNNIELVLSIIFLLVIFLVVRFLMLILIKKTQLKKRSRIMVINHPELYSGLLVDEVFGLKHFQREPEAIDANKNIKITAYLKGSVFQQDIHWDVISFQKLADDERFLNAAA